MDNERRLIWKTVCRFVLLASGTVSIAVTAAVLDHIVLEGRHTFECWFYTDMSACQLERVGATLNILVSCSVLIADQLFDRRTMPRVSLVLLWIEAFLGGQISVLWLGTFLYLLVQWSRTVADFPYITLDDYEHVCPNKTSDDCLIPEKVQASAVVVLFLCIVSVVFWILNSALSKSVMNRMMALSAFQQISPSLSPRSNGQLPSAEVQFDRRPSSLIPSRQSPTPPSPSPVQLPAVVAPPPIIPQQQQQQQPYSHMTRPPVVIPATAPIQEPYSHMVRPPVVVPATIPVQESPNVLRPPIIIPATAPLQEPFNMARPPIIVPATAPVQEPHRGMAPPLQVNAFSLPLENSLQPRANDQRPPNDSDRGLVLNRTGILPAEHSV